MFVFSRRMIYCPSVSISVLSNIYIAAPQKVCKTAIASSIGAERSGKGVQEDRITYKLEVGWRKAKMLANEDSTAATVCFVSALRRREDAMESKQG